MHPCGPVVGKTRESIGKVGCSHGNHVGRNCGVICRIGESYVVIARLISCGGNEKHLVGIGFVNFVQKTLGETIPSPAIRKNTNVNGRGRAGETQLRLYRELDRVNRGRNRAGATGVQELQAHNLRRPVDTGDAERVVACCSE